MNACVLSLILGSVVGYVIGFAFGVRAGAIRFADYLEAKLQEEGIATVSARILARKAGQ